MRVSSMGHKAIDFVLHDNIVKINPCPKLRVTILKPTYDELNEKMI